MNTIAQDLLQLLRCAFHPAQGGFVLPAERWEAVRALAVRHNVQSLLAYAAQSMEGVPEQTAQALRRDLTLTLAQGEIQNHAAEALLAAFEAKGLDVLAVKGVRTRLRYPDPVMRSMGDLDVLCRASDTAAARAVMAELGYGKPREGRKHDLYSMPPYVEVELHRALLSPEMPWADAYSETNVWARCRLREGSRHIYEMTPADEAVFNLVHLAEHLLEGGAGIRFLADVYVYAHLETVDETAFARSVDALGLTRFYETARAIAEHWFGDGAPLTGPAAELAEQILAGGAFGTEAQSAALAVRKGRLGALARAVFPGYRSMMSMFPWLEGKAVLLPYAWALRAARAALHRRDHVGGLLSEAVRGDRAQGAALVSLYRACGLEVRE